MKKGKRRKEGERTGFHGRDQKTSSQDRAAIELFQRVR